jgi:adenine-specific DNA-methyltransferase
MLGERASLFIDVEQEAVVTILRTRSPQGKVTSRTSVSVLSSNGNFDKVGAYLLPNSGSPWLMPRTAEDAELLRKVRIRKYRLKDYGYAARIGHLVGYRDTRRRFTSPPKGAHKRQIVPLVWATDISPRGKFKHKREARYSRTSAYVEIKELSDSGVIRNAAVLLQRLTSSDQKSRLVAAPVPALWVKENSGFVCENHVIILERVQEDGLSPKNLARLLNTKSVDRIFRSISGASNVSISELNHLPLPDPRRIAMAMKRKGNVDVKVRNAYVSSARHKPK